MTMEKLEEMINNADVSNETDNEIREQLKILLSLSKTKMQIFRQEIETDLRIGRTSDQRIVPITSLSGICEEYYAYTNQSEDALLDDVKKSVAGMLSECDADIVNGVSSLITKELTVILGVGSGEEMMQKQSYVLVERQNIIRYDIAMWTRNISVKTLQKQVDNVVAFVAYKSVVDVPKYDFSSFMLNYSTVLQEAFKDDSEKFRAQIFKAKAVFDIYTDNESRSDHRLLF